MSGELKTEFIGGGTDDPRPVTMKTARDLVNSMPSDVEVVYEISTPPTVPLVMLVADAKAKWKPPANVRDSRKKKPWER